MQVMYLATVRGDALRRARQINKEQALSIERHLLFPSASVAMLHLHERAQKLWLHTMANKTGNVMYLRVAQEIDDPKPLLFGTVQPVEVRNE